MKDRCVFEETISNVFGNRRIPGYYVRRFGAKIEVWDGIGEWFHLRWNRDELISYKGEKFSTNTVINGIRLKFVYGE